MDIKLWGNEMTNSIEPIERKSPFTIKAHGTEMSKEKISEPKQERDKQQRQRSVFAIFSMRISDRLNPRPIVNHSK